MAAYDIKLLKELKDEDLRLTRIFVDLELKSWWLANMDFFTAETLSLASVY